MAIRKAPEKQLEAKVDIDELIDRGARVKEDNKEDQKKNGFINLRVPVSLLKDIEKDLKNRVGISRNGWILEAIQEKLRRQTT